MADLSVAIVLAALILTLGFGHCGESTYHIERYKICMEATKDPAKCKDEK